MGLFDKLFGRKKKGKDADQAAPESAQEAAPQTPEADDAPAAADDAPAQIVAPPQADVQTPPQERTRFRTALNRTRAFFASAFSADPSANVNDEYYEELEDALVLADVGTELAGKLVEQIGAEMTSRGLVRQADVPLAARDVLLQSLKARTEPVTFEPGKLSVLMMVGVNGNGKTTLAAKLAHRLKQEGQSVTLCAADTFRAAATDQLRVWAERIDVEIVSGQEGADPSSVVYDACQAAVSRDADVLIVDTAGRLQTKSNLMAELEKIARTVEKSCPGAMIANLLVLDATTGQNALSQAQLFDEACKLSGVALTKLDGTAKGGAVFAIVERLGLPILYLGVGEAKEDILDFDAEEFVTGLLPEAQA